MSVGDRSGYSPLRLVLLVAGVLILAVALTAGNGLGPLTAAIDAVVERVGYDYVVAAGLGAVAVLAGLAIFVSGRGSTMSQAEMPDVERPVPAPAAGERFDDRIHSLHFVTRVFGDTTIDEVRDRLTAAAVVAVVADEGCSRPDARERVESGGWTDDRHAAAFLAGEYTPLGTWLAALANGETGPGFRARRTVAAIRDRQRAAERPTGEGESS